MRGMQQEWSEAKALLSEHKEDVTRAMKALYNGVVERDEYVDKGMDKFQERLNRHRAEIDKSYRREKELRERVEVLEAQVESMSNKLCHCGQSSPAFEEDSGLEYADSPGEYHTPPVSSPVDSIPVENEVPIPIPDRAESAPNNSDQENVPPSCCITALVRRDAVLVPIEEVEEGDPRITTVGQRASRRRDRRIDPYPHRMAAGNKQERLHRYLKFFGDSRVADSELQRRRRDFDYLDSLQSSTDVGGDRSCTTDHDDSNNSLPTQRSVFAEQRPAVGQSRQCGRLDWPISGGLWSWTSDEARGRSSPIGW
jgi:hypothetical protein